MDYRRVISLLLAALGLLGCGFAMALAWQGGLWATLLGFTLAALLMLLSLLYPPMRIRAAQQNLNADADSHGELDELLKLRLLLNALPTPLLSLESGAVRALNASARDHFGSEHMIMHPPPQLFDPLSSRMFYEGRSWSIMRLDDKGGRAIVALIDTEQSENIAEARARSELLQTMGHELMNGLAPVVSLAESAQKAHVAEPRDEALISEILETLVRQIGGLQRFITGYRRLARLPMPDKKAVPIREFFDDLARMFRANWPEVKLRTKADLNVQVNIDREQMSQALWALLQNAVEAIRETDNELVLTGKVELTAKLQQAMLTINVRDNGPGIPADRIDHLFRPFHSTKAGGTGIGLSFARSIALAHGGNLTAQAAGYGQFTVTIPAE